MLLKNHPIIRMGLIILATIILTSVALIFYVRNAAKHDGAAAEVAEKFGLIKTQCKFGAAKKAIDEKELGHPNSCEVKKYKTDEKLKFVSISHGGTPENIAGFTFGRPPEHYYGIVNEEGNLIDFFYPNDAFSILSAKYGRICTKFEYEHDKPTLELRRETRKNKNIYYWELTFDEHQIKDHVDHYTEFDLAGKYECKLDGKLKIYSNIWGHFDDSQLTVEMKTPDCSTIQHETDKTECMVYKAIYSGDISLCDELSISPKEKYSKSKSDCYKAVAVHDNNEKLCAKMDDARSWYLTNHREYRDGCYYQVALHKKDLDICEFIKEDYKKRRCVRQVKKIINIYDYDCDYDCGY